MSFQDNVKPLYEIKIRIEVVFYLRAFNTKGNAYIIIENIKLKDDNLSPLLSPVKSSILNAIAIPTNENRALEHKRILIM